MRIVRDIDTDIGEDSPPERVVGWLLHRFAGRRVVVTTGFGMEGCALIDMIARQGGALPVLYLDTGFLFPETLRAARPARGAVSPPELRAAGHLAHAGGAGSSATGPSSGPASPTPAAPSARWSRCAKRWRGWTCGSRD